MEQRERLGSRIGFIMLSAGCAIGCGNIWKFPWMTGQNGGGGFVLIYILWLILFGLPVMIMEFSIGRASQKSIVKMYQALEKPRQKWHLHGYVALIGNISLMAFYTVVVGWMMYYFKSFLTGKSEELSFGGMISNPGINVGYMLLAVIICFTILCFKLQGGIERVTKYMMSILFVLMIIIAVRSCTLDNAMQGIKFYLVPDFRKITISTVVAAMNQAFFSLSLGIGAMAIFGSYVNKERTLMSESIMVISLDTFVAIMAGIIIFPACASYNVEVNAGPSLLFDTMATVFNHMEGGRFWGSLFFLLMVFAAFSTELAVCENILSAVRDLLKVKRPLGALISGVVVAVLSTTTALGYSLWSGFHPFAEDTAWLDFWDFIVSTNLLPLGSLIIAVFCCADRFGWGWDNFVSEANTGKGLKVKRWMKPLFKYAVPLATIFIYIYGMITFKWK